MPAPAQCRTSKEADTGEEERGSKVGTTPGRKAGRRRKGKTTTARASTKQQMTEKAMNGHHRKERAAGRFVVSAMMGAGTGWYAISKTWLGGDLGVEAGFATLGATIAIYAHMRWNTWQDDAGGRRRARNAKVAEQEAEEREAQQRERAKAKAKASNAANDAKPRSRRFEQSGRVWLKWADEDRTCIESMRIEVTDRDPRFAKHGATERVEIEELEPEVVLGILRQYREENRRALVNMIERGLDAKQLTWWLKHRRKEVETKLLAVRLDVARRAGEEATVRSGEFEGKRVTSMTRTEFERLLETLDREDPRGAQFARQIFDHTRPEWRDGKEPTSGWAPVEGKMSKAEAREYLAVDENASADEIKERARILRHRTHPDKKGSAKIFRMIGEALKVLSK